MFVEGVGNERRDGHASAPCPCFWWSEGECPTNLDHDLGDLEPSAKEVHAGSPQSEQLSGAQGGVRGHQHGSPIPVVDGLGQHGDFLRGEKAHLLSLELRKRHTLAWGGGDEAGVDGRAHDLGEDLGGFHDGRR